MKNHKKSNSIFYPIIFTVLIGLLWAGTTVPVYAENPKDDNHSSSVRISWDEFKKFLRLDVDEVVLSWDEFKKLLAQTGSEVKVEYNIQNGKVVLQRDQFKKLLAQMKPPDVTPLRPPSDYLITKAEYFGVMKKKSTTFTARFYLEIFKKERSSYPKIRLLPQSVALREIKLNNAKALIMIENGWYVLTTDKVGQHIIDLEFSVKSDIDKGPDVLNLTIPQTAITLFKIDIPIKDVTVEIPQGKHMTISRVGGHTIVDAVLSTTSYIQLKLHRVIVVEKKRGPAKIYVETMNLLSIEDDALRATTRFKLNILQNAISNIKMYIPKGYSVLYVRDQRWQEIRDWKTEKVKDREVLTVPFEGEKEGTVIFTVVSEKIFTEKENEIEFNGFRTLKAIRETGYVGAEKKSTAEAEIFKSENIDRVDIQELPLELVNMSAKPLIFGLRYLRHPFLLTLRITKHEELPVVNTVIDNAFVMSVFLEEGKVITRIVYTMRNTGKQFLELELPLNAEIWSLYVNGKREIPARNEEGRFMIPLARSRIVGENIASFDVEVLYYYKINKFAITGAKRLQFPTADVVISRMLWSCYFPDDYRFIHFGGNVEKEKLATGIRPLLGKTRVFNYDEINGYNRALEDWEGSTEQVADKRIRKTQKLLKSEFRTSALNKKDAFLGQLRQEIDFAENIQREQQQGIISGGVAGMALLKIEIPTSGQLYRFAKTLIEGEELYLDFQYVRGWISTVIKILILFLLIYIIYLLRLKIKNKYMRIKEWAISHQDFWDKCKSPEGVLTILGLSAIVFWFVFRFFFVIFVLLFLIVWLKPDWIFKEGRK